MKKVALVCASSKGIGKAIAISLAKNNYNIVVNGREKESVLATVKIIEKYTEVLPIVIDITEKKATNFIITKTLNKFKTVDILINNIGGPKPGRFIEKDELDWQEAFELLLVPFIKLTKAVIPIMQKKQWGRIVNITSITAKEPSPNLILSNPFRAAVISISKTLSQEYAKDNILINSVCPASVLSNRTLFLLKEIARKENVKYKEIYNRVVKDLPMQKFQSTEEVANLVTFLCTEKASAITGTAINVDGGSSKFIF